MKGKLDTREETIMAITAFQKRELTAIIIAILVVTLSPLLSCTDLGMALNRIATAAIQVFMVIFDTLIFMTLYNTME